MSRYYRPSRIIVGPLSFQQPRQQLFIFTASKAEFDNMKDLPRV
jgi:hypothetical protein